MKRDAKEIVSKTPVPSGKWTHIAAVYDLKELILCINGTEQGRVPCLPSSAQEWIGSVTIGGKCQFPYIPVPSFTGGIRKVRIYGRNLSPDEFLYRN